jgi:hypothetical protein
MVTSDDGTMTSHFGVGYIPAGAENRPFIQDSLAAYAVLRQEMQHFDPEKQYLLVVPNLADLQFVIRDRKQVYMKQIDFYQIQVHAPSA